MADKTKVGMEFPLYTFEVEKESKDHVKLIYWDSVAAKASRYGDIVPSPIFQTCFAL